MSIFRSIYMMSCTYKTTESIILLLLMLLLGACGQKGGLERPETTEIFLEKQSLHASSLFVRG